MVNYGMHIQRTLAMFGILTNLCMSAPSNW